MPTHINDFDLESPKPEETITRPLWPKEPFFSNNPTDGQLFVESIYPGPDNFEGWDKLESEPLEGESMALYQLAHVMANETDYGNALSRLWGYFGFEKATEEIGFPKWNASLIADRISRARVWYWILARLTTYEKYCQGNTEDGTPIFVESILFGGLGDRIHQLQTYHESECKRAVKDTQKQNCEHFIKLSELREIFKIIQKSSLFSETPIPLPKTLFPIEAESSNSAEDQTPDTDNFGTESDRRPIIRTSPNAVPEISPHPGETPIYGWEKIAKCAGWSTSKAKHLTKEFQDAGVVTHEYVGRPPQRRVKAWPSDIKHFVKNHKI